MLKSRDRGFPYELTFNKTRRDIGDIFENSFFFFFLNLGGLQLITNNYFFILHFKFASCVFVLLVMKANSWFLIFTYLRKIMH